MTKNMAIYQDAIKSLGVTYKKFTSFWVPFHEYKYVSVLKDLQS